MKKKIMNKPTMVKGSNYAACVACPGSQISIGVFQLLLPFCSALALAG